MKTHVGEFSTSDQTWMELTERYVAKPFFLKMRHADALLLFNDIFFLKKVIKIVCLHIFVLHDSEATEMPFMGRLSTYSFAVIMCITRFAHFHSET